jgi:hypothetical protein
VQVLTLNSKEEADTDADDDDDEDSVVVGDVGIGKMVMPKMPSLVSEGDNMLTFTM